MNKRIHFFDLDGTLWKTNAHWWIVSKNNPNKPLMKITQEDGAKAISGDWKEYGYFINGIAWLSPEMYHKLNNQDLTNLDLRFDEFFNIKYLNKQAKNIDIYINNIKHLSNTTDTISLLTARGNRDNHKHLLDKLSNTLSEMNIFLSDKLYFVNDINKKRLQDSSANLKANILLEHLIGFKITQNGFSDEQDEYDNVIFYDDEWKNIETSLNIKNILNEILNKSKYKYKEFIKTKLKKNKVLISKFICGDDTKEFILEI